MRIQARLGVVDLPLLFGENRVHLKSDQGAGDDDSAEELVVLHRDVDAGGVGLIVRGADVKGQVADSGKVNVVRLKMERGGRGKGT